MTWFIFGLIFGMFAMYKIVTIYEKVKVNYALMGFDLTSTRNKVDKENVVKIVKAKPIISNNSCEFCNDEDIYIAGTKDIMPCPKCKKNTKKKVLLS
jgi:hypothetical protein